MDKWIEVKHIMTTDLITADPDETIDAVRHKLIANHIQHIPVVEGKKILGIISKGDIHRMEHHFTLFQSEKALESNRQIFSTILAAEIMTKSLVKLKDTDSATIAVDLFRENMFHALPVVNDKDQLVGMITPIDLLRYAFDDVKAIQR
ncbi:MAG: CBS domain-containing protein [Saprospiraceae bacterium]|nr:CBS domain-containing protein [Candidatus Opimibacter skivensis]MBL0008481.1 CBS domain-containing protein [Candidatus Opimibacter skivensis]MBP6680397.1 CBS domain-containing protein [Saprospiraceae bacterium]HQW25269.1 CBS domain-containing protein [Saprospiraceae bacterium]